MDESFSERYGYSRVPENQLIYEDAPEELRVYITKVVYENMQKGPRFLRPIICHTLLVREDPSNWSEYPNIASEVEDMLHGAQWFQVYDIIESLATTFRKLGKSNEFEETINHGFRRLRIGWQLKDGVVQTRGDEAFERNLSIAEDKLQESGFMVAQKELREAIHDLSRRPESDLRGTIQHAVGALESVAREIVGDQKKTLGEILRKYPDLIPKPLDDSLSKMWGYASDSARHVREGQEIERKEAQLILGISTVIITYLIEGAHV